MNEDCFVTKTRKKYLTEKSFPSFLRNDYFLNEQGKKEEILNTFLEHVVCYAVTILHHNDDNLGANEEIREIRCWLEDGMEMDEEYATTICDFIHLCMKIVGREANGLKKFMELTPSIVCEPSSLVGCERVIYGTS